MGTTEGNVCDRVNTYFRITMANRHLGSVKKQIKKEWYNYILNIKRYGGNLKLLNIKVSF